MIGWLEKLDRALARLLTAGMWLSLPVSLLLFLQWPLRDLVHGYATDANDLAQWIFALYVSLAIVYATRERAHLAADSFVRRYPPAVRERIMRVAALAAIVPWALLILIAGGPMVWRSARILEDFPETYSPGYFIIKGAAWAMALLMLVQALIDALKPSRRG